MRRLFESKPEDGYKLRPRALSWPPSTPTALRPLAQGWPRNEAYPGSTSQPSPNHNVVVAGLLRQFPHRPELPPSCFRAPCALRGSTLRRCSTTKDTNDTKPNPPNPRPSRGSRPGGATDLHPVRPPTFGRFSRTQRPGTRSGQAAKPRSREERRGGITSCLRVPPLLPETHFHAETPSPPRLEYPFIRAFLDARAKGNGGHPIDHSVNVRLDDSCFGTGST
jgi:hypothetical protein